jgi:hypothetical protein
MISCFVMFYLRFYFKSFFNTLFCNPNANVSVVQVTCSDLSKTILPDPFALACLLCCLVETAHRS